MYLQDVLQLSHLVMFLRRWKHHMGIVKTFWMKQRYMSYVREHNLNFKTSLKGLMNSTEGMHTPVGTHINHKIKQVKKNNCNVLWCVQC